MWKGHETINIEGQEVSQKSRSHEAENRFGGLAETLFLIPLVWSICFSS